MDTHVGGYDGVEGEGEDGDAHLQGAEDEASQERETERE